MVKETKKHDVETPEFTLLPVKEPPPSKTQRTEFYRNIINEMSTKPSGWYEVKISGNRKPKSVYYSLKHTIMTEHSDLTLSLRGETLYIRKM